MPDSRDYVRARNGTEGPAVALLAPWSKRAIGLAIAFALIAPDAVAAVPAHPHASAAQIGAARRILDANGYKDITVISSDDQMVTVAAMKDGAKAVVDVDPMTGIVLPHVDMPPIPAQLAPVTGVPPNPR
jgi:hypothetical protein